ncbi:hypothetical protein ACFRAE_14900 [Sphingobacterium sp. HJSM2_6]|uniref:hypothetical protein n=1 Tax=Sphingobacterium sp. HJSM2_6 TaxID=3366264 RepID=UPI003BC194BB
MSKITVYHLAIFAFSIIIMGCQKDSSNPGEDVNSNYLKVSVDGVEKNYPTVSAYWVEGGNYLSINAVDQNKESLAITVMSETSRVPIGQYSLQDNSGFTLLSMHSLFNAENQLHHTATRNTVAVEDDFQLKIDKITNSSAEGSFTGTLVRVEGLNTLGKIVLTGGKFKTTIKPN